MSLMGARFKSFEDVQQAASATGHTYVSKNTEYVLGILKTFTLRYECYGTFRSRGTTGKRTSSKKCGCTSLIRRVGKRNEKSEIEYEVTFHDVQHNHEPASKLGRHVADQNTVASALLKQVTKSAYKNRIAYFEAIYFQIIYLQYNKESQ